MARKEQSTRPIARNPKARHIYQIVDTYEAGVALQGTEVKSLRQGNCSIQESYATMRGDELYLVNMHIPPYPQAHGDNHEPKRARKLLLHRNEINRIASQCAQRGWTVIPLAVYFRESHVKVQIGLATRKTLADKRDKVEEQQRRKDVKKALRHRP